MNYTRRKAAAVAAAAGPLPQGTDPVLDVYNQYRAEYERLEKLRETVGDDEVDAIYADRINPLIFQLVTTPATGPLGIACKLEVARDFGDWDAPDIDADLGLSALGDAKRLTESDQQAQAEVERFGELLKASKATIDGAADEAYATIRDSRPMTLKGCAAQIRAILGDEVAPDTQERPMLEHIAKVLAGGAS